MYVESIIGLVLAVLILSLWKFIKAEFSLLDLLFMNGLWIASSIVLLLPYYNLI